MRILPVTLLNWSVMAKFQCVELILFLDRLCEALVQM